MIVLDLVVAFIDVAIQLFSKRQIGLFDDCFSRLGVFLDLVLILVLVLGFDIA